MLYMIDCESLKVSHIAENINISAIKATESGFIVTESRNSNVVMIQMTSFQLFGDNTGGNLATNRHDDTVTTFYSEYILN